MSGVTLPSIDRMLAQIDRELAPPFRLPAMCPAIGWAVTIRLDQCILYPCWTEVDPDGIGICEPHLAEMRSIV